MGSLFQSVQRGTRTCNDRELARGMSTIAEALVITVPNNIKDAYQRYLMPTRLNFDRNAQNICDVRPQRSKNGIPISFLF